VGDLWSIGELAKGISHGEEARAAYASLLGRTDFILPKLIISFD
jgi:hypothetical protein